MSRKTANPEGVYRYNLVLPTSEFMTLKAAADKRGHSVASMLRMFIGLGLEIYQAQKNGNPIIRRENGKDTELIIF